MKEFLHKWPLHTFLIGLYFIFFIYVRNLSSVTFDMTIRSICVTVVLSLLLFGITYLFFRSRRKAGIFTTFLLLGFFTYGAIYNAMEHLYFTGYWPFLHIHRVLIGTFFLIYLSLFVLFLKSKRPHLMVNYTMNIFVITIFIINAFFIVTSAKKHKSGSNNYNALIPVTKLPDSISAAAKPDVYYIVLDGYASEKSLKNFYGDKHPVLYSYLRKKGFYIADSSSCNYTSTDPSLSSSLNLNYIDTLKQKVIIRQNLVNLIFKKAGYRNVNIGSGYSVTEKIELVDKTVAIRSANEFESRLLEVTILRIDDLLGFSNFNRLKSELDRLPLVANEAGPKFSFIHIVAPHPPFVMDADGNRVIRGSLSDGAWEPKSDYHAQLTYVSKRVIAFIEELLKKPGIPPVIILQSDHGPWISDKNPQNVFEVRKSILNAYYVPDSVKKELYPAITPVNSFRLLFSKMYRLDFPLLADRAISLDSLSKNITFRKYTE